MATELAPRVDDSVVTDVVGGVEGVGGSVGSKSAFAFKTTASKALNRKLLVETTFLKNKRRKFLLTCFLHLNHRIVCLPSIIRCF